MDTLIYGGLIVVPASDINYKMLLKEATREQLKEAIELMENRNCRDKSRIDACRRELRKRR